MLCGSRHRELTDNSLFRIKHLLVNFPYRIIFE